MKIKNAKSLSAQPSTVIIPVMETNSHSIVPIEYNGISIPSKVFYGKKDTTYFVHQDQTTYLFVGLGSILQHHKIVTGFRRISAKHSEMLHSETLVVLKDSFVAQDVEAMLIGLKLGTYSLKDFKNESTHILDKEGSTVTIVSETDFSESAKRALKIANAQIETMKLVDAPPNVATPNYLADWALDAGKKFGFDVKTFDREQSKEQNLHAFVAVGQGSENEPRFIIMEYRSKSPASKHIGLVGKGVTFDTGGLNIKTSGMVNMKCDMAGAAAVLGTMQLVADLQLNVNITAIVPACENSVDAKSFLPSDVISSHSGSRIEIIDTDAEGRLILADGISYLIKNHNPDIVVDIATLTGSSVATFGYECAALFTNNEALRDDLIKAGNNVGEKLWQLPLWDEYASDIESEIADVRNYSGKPLAGAITAAKFLQHFTQDHKSWAHLDIAGVAFGDDEFAKSKHATAYGVQLLTKFIENSQNG